MWYLGISKFVKCFESLLFSDGRATETATVAAAGEKDPAAATSPTDSTDSTPGGSRGAAWRGTGTPSFHTDTGRDRTLLDGGAHWS